MNRHGYDADTLNPRIWRTIRRMAQRLVWTTRWLALLGWLDRSGRCARWAARHLAEVEHGLRCLFVIALQARPRADACIGKGPPPGVSGKASAARQRPRVRRAFDLSVAALLRRLGVEPDAHESGEPPISRQPPPFAPFRGTSPACGGREFSGVETVSVLSSPVYGGSTGEAGDGGRLPPAPPSPNQTSRSPTQALLARANALAAAIASPDPLIDRLARRLAARGLRIVRRILRPCAATPVAIARVHTPMPDAPPPRAPAICDSS